MVNEGLQRMNTSDYFDPLKDWMNGQHISMNVLTERAPCRAGGKGCYNFLKDNLPYNSNVGSNYNAEDQSGDYISNARKQLINTWEQKNNPNPIINQFSTPQYNQNMGGINYPSQNPNSMYPPQYSRYQPPSNQVQPNYNNQQYQQQNLPKSGEMQNSGYQKVSTGLSAT